MHLHRAALGQPGLVRPGVRDRDQLRPLQRVGHALQLTGDLEQLLRAHRATPRGQLRTDRGGLGAQARRSGPGAGWSTYLIILEHTYESKGYPPLRRLGETTGPHATQPDAPASAGTEPATGHPERRFGNRQPTVSELPSVWPT